MAIDFTPEQKQVIELHNCNILVSAAAGSGKTAVLSERIVQMVCRKEDPVDIDRLLIVTFTNAAAAEMRERISQAILKRLAEDGENEHLQRQAALLHNAQITTIDSFCLFVLRNNFEDIGLDPGFRVADEGELELLRQDVLAELLEACFEEGSEDFLHCVEYFCPNGRESALEKHILDLHGYALSNPFPEEWLLARKQDYQAEGVGELEKSDWGRYLLAHLQRIAGSLCREMEEVKALCEQPDGPYMYGELVESELEQISKLAELDSLAAFEQKLPAITFGRLSTKKDDSVSPQKKELAKERRKAVKDSITKLQEQFFTLPLEGVVRQSAECEKAVATLVDLCLAFKEKLDAKKREKKMLDFSDMEHFALQILLERTEDGQVVPTKTAREYRDYFKEVLIDEYQDSNLVQEYLLKAISGEEDGVYNRFMVGDVKQSIYKFRLARPELFLEKYHTYSLEEGVERRIDLHKNFRSRREVVDTVNHIFSKIMTKELGGIVYDDAAALYPGAVYPENSGCESELLLFEKPEKGAELNAKQVEAAGIAARIKELKKNFQVLDKENGEMRPVQYRDMVVLLRSNSGWDEEFKEVFAKEGIPAYISSKTGYFATKEIQDVLQFLRMLDNPLQDIPVFGVMKSVFGGFSDEEAALVKVAGKEEAACLYDCLKICAGRTGAQAAGNSVQDVLQEKCARFLARVEKYRGYTAYMPILELLKTLFEEYNYLPYVATLPGGSQRLANVEMLLTKAAGFEKGSYYGLFHFIRYMEQLEKYNVDYGEANILDENADVVRIMSIHKSKGLEFPVAFVAGLSKRFNMQDTAQPMIVDMDLGIGVDYVNPDARIKCKTLRKNVLAEKMKLDNLAEELRVLYVALTRAKEKLIMTATIDAKRLEQELEATQLAGAEGFAEETMTYAKISSASGFLDLIRPIFAPSKVMTLEEMALDGLFADVAEGNRLEALSQTAVLADEEQLAALRARFAYEYPHKNLENLFTKTTVSELKMAAMEGHVGSAMGVSKEEPGNELFPQEEIVPYVPRFMREKEEVSGTTRGSAVHRIMELLDFTAEYQTVEDIKTVMESRMQDGRLTEEYRNVINPKKVLQFMQSHLAQRMKQAAERGKLFREQPFVYGISAERLSTNTEQFPAEETVLIQGIVDVFFEEEDGIVLLDYKTDVIGAPEELVKRYKTQLDYYQEALESITGKPVKERILYSFYLGCEVVCPYGIEKG